MSEKKYLLFHITRGIIGQNLSAIESRIAQSGIPSQDVMEIEMQNWTQSEIQKAKTELILQAITQLN
jgi:hypothetical protein